MACWKKQKWILLLFEKHKSDGQSKKLLFWKIMNIPSSHEFIAEVKALLHQAR